MRIATRYSVRPMTVADVPQVLEVERESFPTMWPSTAFKRELQQNDLARYLVVVQRNPTAGPETPSAQHDSSARGPVGWFLGEVRQILGSDEARPLQPPEDRPELIVGFIGIWLIPEEAHIVTFAVRETHRRQGIGERLLIAVLEMALEETQPLVTLECRVSNKAALRLYEKYSFEKVGLRPRYYSDNREDAYVLTAASLASDTYRAQLERLKSEHERRWGDFEDGGAFDG